MDEKADLLVQIQDQNREISVLRRSLGFGETASTDAMKMSCSSSHVSNEDLKPLLIERDSLKAKVKEMENELKILKPDAKKPVEIEEKTPEKTL